MTLLEATEGAGAILACFPHGHGTDEYIGKLVLMLMDFPKAVAKACCHPTSGIVRECKFMPTPADIAHWCEHRVVDLQRQLERQRREDAQFSERAAFEHRERERGTRLTYDQLIEKYGDWRKPVEQGAKHLREAAKAVLVAQIGEDAFNQIPDARKE